MGKLQKMMRRGQRDVDAVSIDSWEDVEDESHNDHEAPRRSPPKVAIPDSGIGAHSAQNNRLGARKSVGLDSNLSPGDAYLTDVERPPSGSSARYSSATEEQADFAKIYNMKVDGRSPTPVFLRSRENSDLTMRNAQYRPAEVTTGAEEDRPVSPASYVEGDDADLQGADRVSLDSDDDDDTPTGPPLEQPKPISGQNALHPVISLTPAEQDLQRNVSMLTKKESSSSSDGPPRPLREMPSISSIGQSRSPSPTQSLRPGSVETSPKKAPVSPMRPAFGPRGNAGSDPQTGRPLSYVAQPRDARGSLVPERIDVGRPHSKSLPPVLTAGAKDSISKNVKTTPSQLARGAPPVLAPETDPRLRAPLSTQSVSRPLIGDATALTAPGANGGPASTGAPVNTRRYSAGPGMMNRMSEALQSGSVPLPTSSKAQKRITLTPSALRNETPISSEKSPMAPLQKPMSIAPPHTEPETEPEPAKRRKRVSALFSAIKHRSTPSESLLGSTTQGQGSMTGGTIDDGRSMSKAQKRQSIEITGLPIPSQQPTFRGNDIPAAKYARQAPHQRGPGPTGRLPAQNVQGASMPYAPRRNYESNTKAVIETFKSTPSPRNSLVVDRPTSARMSSTAPTVISRFDARSTSPAVSPLVATSSSPFRKPLTPPAAGPVSPIGRNSPQQPVQGKTQPAELSKAQPMIHVTPSPPQPSTRVPNPHNGNGRPGQSLRDAPSPAISARAHEATNPRAVAGILPVKPALAQMPTAQNLLPQLQNTTRPSQPAAPNNVALGSVPAVQSNLAPAIRTQPTGQLPPAEYRQSQLAAPRIDTRPSMDSLASSQLQADSDPSASIKTSKKKRFSMMGSSLLSMANNAASGMKSKMKHDKEPQKPTTPNPGETRIHYVQDNPDPIGWEADKSSQNSSPSTIRPVSGQPGQSSQPNQASPGQIMIRQPTFTNKENLGRPKSPVSPDTHLNKNMQSVQKTAVPLVQRSQAPPRASDTSAPRAQPVSENPAPLQASRVQQSLVDNSSTHRPQDAMPKPEDSVTSPAKTSLFGRFAARASSASSRLSPQVSNDTQRGDSVSSGGTAISPVSTRRDLSPQRQDARETGRPDPAGRLPSLSEQHQEQPYQIVVPQAADNIEAEVAGREIRAAAEARERWLRNDAQETRHSQDLSGHRQSSQSAIPPILSREIQQMKPQSPISQGPRNLPSAKPAVPHIFTQKQPQVTVTQPSVRKSTSGNLLQQSQGMHEPERRSPVIGPAGSAEVTKMMDPRLTIKLPTQAAEELIRRKFPPPASPEKQMEQHKIQHLAEYRTQEGALAPPVISDSPTSVYSRQTTDMSRNTTVVDRNSAVSPNLDVPLSAEDKEMGMSSPNSAVNAHNAALDKVKQARMAVAASRQSENPSVSPDTTPGQIPQSPTPKIASPAANTSTPRTPLPALTPPTTHADPALPSSPILPEVVRPGNFGQMNGHLPKELHRTRSRDAPEPLDADWHLARRLQDEEDKRREAGGEGEDEPPKMFATSFPGDEWQPDFDPF